MPEVASQFQLRMRLTGIYREEGIKIDRWDLKSSRIRAVYFCDNDDRSVMVNKNLPVVPKLFSLVHELKHHYRDQRIIQSGKIHCGDYNANQVIEIGAEVFAAEFIYPENEMRGLIQQLDIKGQNNKPEKVVEFKRACLAPISYQFIVKRFERFGLCSRGSYKGVRFQQLEEAHFGMPIYKQPWFQRHREKKAARSL